METDQQGWMNPDEDAAITYVSCLDAESYILREVIFNETRVRVWETAVGLYAPSRAKHVKSYCSYVNMVNDQDKLLMLAVESPCEEASQIAAAKLTDKSSLEKRYRTTDDEQERERILTLIDDDEGFVNAELAKLAPDALERLFASIVDVVVARRFCDGLPDTLVEAKALARQRFSQLSSEDDLLALMRDEQEDHDLRAAAIAQLYQITEDKKYENKRIKLRPDDQVIISRFACEGDEDNPARKLLSRQRICWKCGTTMNLNGTTWGPQPVLTDFYNTKGRVAVYLCPKCGNEVYEQVESWR